MSQPIELEVAPDGGGGGSPTLDSRLTSLDTANLKGVIILFQHGFNGTPSDWKAHFNQVYDHRNHLNAVVFKDNYIQHNSSVSNHPIFQDLSQNKASYLNKVVFIRTNFPDNYYGPIVSQANELNTIIGKIKQALGTYHTEYKFALVGHSKGGLVNMRFWLKYPNILNSLVSVNTPYCGAKDDVIQSGWDVLMGGILGTNMLSTQISALNADWNARETLPLVSAIGTNRDGSGHDGLVSVISALGNGNNLIFSNINTPYQRFYERVEMSGSGNDYEHAGSLGNMWVTRKIISELIRHFADIGSSGSSST